MGLTLLVTLMRGSHGHAVSPSLRCVEPNRSSRRNHSPADGTATLRVKVFSVTHMARSFMCRSPLTVRRLSPLPEAEPAQERRVSR